jgi:hypothetical protein
MKTCDKCGATIWENPQTSSGLDFLEDLSDTVSSDSGKTLCGKCREEKRLTGAALLDDMDGLWNMKG